MLLAFASALGIGGVLALHRSWAGKGRHRGLVIAGWFMLGGGAVLAGLAEGAWGVAIAALPTMTTALIILAVAAWRCPPPQEPRPGKVRRPARPAPRRIPARLATFAIIAIGALFASLALALGARSAALAMSWGEANANVVMLFVLPVAWSALAYALLVAPNRNRQFAILAASSIPILPALL